jgi:SAM-dependent methyltransferase
MAGEAAKFVELIPGPEGRQLTPQHQQLSNRTALDRYPSVFAAAAANAPPSPAKGWRTILSYGCSTGEEAATLADKYFPDDIVVGLDVYEPALAVARERHPNDRIIYDDSTPETLVKYGLFDCIFAMSVLCRWPATFELEDCSRVYTFKEFETAIETLDRELKPRGILTVYNSNFSFLDTAVSSRYEVLAGAGIWKNGFVHRFDRDHRRVRTVSSDCIYRKLSDAT